MLMKTASKTGLRLPASVARCLRLAGRGPNIGSLFPPLAAVASVAGHSIARPIAFGNRVPPQRTLDQETTGVPKIFAPAIGGGAANCRTAPADEMQGILLPPTISVPGQGKI